MKEIMTKAELLAKNKRFAEAREAERKKRAEEAAIAAQCEACKIEEKPHKNKKPAARKYMVVEENEIFEDIQEKAEDSDVSVADENTEEIKEEDK